MLHNLKPYNQKKEQQQGVTSWLLVLFAAALVIVSIIASTLSYKFAYRKGYHQANEEATVTADGVVLNLEGLKQIQLDNELLKSASDTAKQERDITLGNLTDLRKRMEELTTINLQLKQTLDLYGEKISDQGGIPLQIIGAKIEALPEDAFEYRFDVLQLTDDGKAKTLRPRIELLNDTSFVEIPLKPSSYEISGVARIRGRFVMPEGFNPLQVKLTLRSGGEDLEQLYNWRFGKRKNDVPISLAEIPEPDQRPIVN